MWVWRPLSSMYSAVPPPDFLGEPSCAGASSEQKQEEKSKPANVQEHQWKVRNVNTLFGGAMEIQAQPSSPDHSFTD